MKYSKMVLWKDGLMLLLEWLLSYFIILFIVKSLLKLNWLSVLAIFLSFMIFIFIIRITVKIILYFLYFRKREMDNCLEILKECNYPKGYGELKNNLQYIYNDSENKEETRLSASAFAGYYNGIMEGSLIKSLFEISSFESAYKKYKKLS